MANFAEYYAICKDVQVHKENDDANVSPDAAVTPEEGQPTDDKTVDSAAANTDEATELLQTANDTEKLEESKEQAEAVVQDVEKDIASQEEIVEKSPEAVTTQDAVVATEMFKAHAFKLGVDLDNVGLSVKKESIQASPAEAMKENVTNMKKFVEIAKESISSIDSDIKANREYMWDMAFAYTTHKEYNAFDWPKAFFGGAITGLWRKFVKGGKTKVDNPGILVDLFLGKWTTYGDLLSGLGMSLPAAAISASKSKTAASPGGYSETVKDAENAYYKLVTNRSSKFSVEEARKLIKDFDVIVANLKKGPCKTIPLRDLALGELNDLKLFRPDLIKPEIDKAWNEARKDAKDEKTQKEWDDIYNHISKSAFGVVKYLTDNLVSYDYTEGKSVK